MIYRTKIGFSHWWQVLLLLIIPFVVIILYNSLTDGLPAYISFSVYAASALCPVCGFVALSAVLKTDYALDETCLIINYNREKPLIIQYEKIESFEIKKSNAKLHTDIVSYARSTDTVYIKYLNDTAKKVRIEISPCNKRDFIKMLAQKTEEYKEKSKETVKSAETAKEKQNIDNNDINDIYETKSDIDIFDYDEFESRNKENGFKINLPEDFFNDDK